MGNLFAIDREDQALINFCDLIASGETPEGSFARTVQTFPDCADLLAAFAVSQTYNASNAVVDGEISTQYQTIVARVASAFSPPPITSLTVALKSAGWTVQSAGELLRVGRTIMIKLDRRLIDLGSIPQQLLTSLSDLIFEPMEQITAYLVLDPIISKTAGARNDTHPSSAKKPFRHALSASLETNNILPEDFKYWMTIIQE
jgi:hypothetical protein